MSTPFQRARSIDEVKRLRRDGASFESLALALEAALQLAHGPTRAELADALGRVQAGEPEALQAVDAAVAAGTREAWRALFGAGS